MSIQKTHLKYIHSRTPAYIQGDLWNLTAELAVHPVLCDAFGFHEADQMCIGVGFEIFILVVMRLDILFRSTINIFQFSDRITISNSLLLQSYMIMLLIFDQVIFAVKGSFVPGPSSLHLNLTHVLGYRHEEGFNRLQKPLSRYLVSIFFYISVIVCFALVTNQVIEISKMLNLMISQKTIGIWKDDFHHTYRVILRYLS